MFLVDQKTTLPSFIFQNSSSSCDIYCLFPRLFPRRSFQNHLRWPKVTIFRFELILGPLKFLFGIILVLLRAPA